jgi:hypothetical protein
MDESLAVKIVDWLLLAVLEERRAQQICCHAAPQSTLSELFQQSAFKTASIKLATRSRTFTLTQVFYF